jgi:hypothetical protein
MTPQVTITVDNGQISVKGPYNETCNKIYREKGGKFDKANGWVFEDKDYIREMLGLLFGWTEGCGTKEISVRAADCGHKILSKYMGGNYAVLHYSGYLIATRNGRDAKARIAPGVALEKGEFPSCGGSVKNPACYPDAGAVIRIAVYDGWKGKPWQH